MRIFLRQDPSQVQVDIQHAAVRRALKNLKPLHGRLVVSLSRWVQKNFEAEGALHEGPEGPWNKLSEYTKMKRRLKGRFPPYKILQETGSLKTRWVEYADKQKGVLTSGVNYSSFHEFGGKSTDLGVYTQPRKVFPTEKQAYRILTPVVKQYFDGLTLEVRKFK